MKQKSLETQDQRIWRQRNAARCATPDIVPGVPDDLSHSVDEYGSLVTVEPADWLICFVPGLQKQWWHRFVNARHKHVFAMRPTDTASWILVEPWWTRLMVTLLPSADAVKFLRWGASGDILRVREAVPGHGNQARGWSNCAVLASFVLGRASRTWTPHGLYLQLSREKGVKHENVEQLLVDQFTKLVGNKASDALKLSPEIVNAPLKDVLTSLGRNMLFAIMDPSLLQLCHTSVIEAERFPQAALVYSELGIKPAIAALTTVLKAANARGEACIPNCQRAAAQFIAILRGNVHLEAVIELRSPPSIAEAEARVRTTVAIFLHGVRSTLTLARPAPHDGCYASSQSS